MADKLEAPSRVALLIADVDGTLVTEDKLLTERAGGGRHLIEQRLEQVVIAPIDD